MKLNTTRHKQAIKRLLQQIRLRYLAHIDVARFSRTASFSVFDDDFHQVSARIMYNVHALEKGLARTNDLRLGFGRKALANLNDALVVFVRRGYANDSFAYVEGVSVIQRYRELHERYGHDTGYLRDLIDPTFLQRSARSTAAGTKIVRRVEKEENSTKGFYDLAQGRSSVREFSGAPIDHNRVMRALQNATKTPSVCNRQGWSVHWIDDKDLARAVLKHQRGFGYPQMPEVLLVITVSNGVFLSPVERNEAFVDGGLFSMSVMYGLEYEGLAAVPLNAMMYSRDQRAVRDLVEIHDSEMIIMFIAVGEFMEESTVPISDRRPALEFVKRRTAPAVDLASNHNLPSTGAVV